MPVKYECTICFKLHVARLLMLNNNLLCKKITHNLPVDTEHKLANFQPFGMPEAASGYLNLQTPQGV